MPAVDWRPKSAAFSVQSTMAIGPAGSQPLLELDPESPTCIGALSCVGTVAGVLPADLVPPLTGQYPLIRTFRITQPSNYARTVFIESLIRAGVAVDAVPVAVNPSQALPARNAYVDGTRVAELVSHPYRDQAKHVMKVSYNVGADVSLMLFGLTKGATTLAGAKAAELLVLANDFGISGSDVDFPDGSGGGLTTATGSAVTQLLRGMAQRPTFPQFLDSLPLLGVDGSLSFVTDFEADPTLAGASGQVRAKTGTFVTVNAQGPPVARAPIGSEGGGLGKAGETAINIVSGATYGSTFVGMVHILRRQTTDSTQRMKSDQFATTAQTKLSFAGWFNLHTGAFGTDTQTAKDVKDMFSRSDIDSHVSVITMGVIPSIASQEVKHAIKEFSDFNGQKMMENLGALSTAQRTDRETMQAAADNSRLGGQMLALKSANVRAVMLAVAEVQEAAQKTFDTTSLMTAFEDYIAKCTADTGCPGCWPIASATYILVPLKGRNGNSSFRVLEFFERALQHGDESATKEGYVPLPTRAKNIVSVAMRRWYASLDKAGAAKPQRHSQEVQAPTAVAVLSKPW